MRLEFRKKRQRNGPEAIMVGSETRLPSFAAPIMTKPHSQPGVNNRNLLYRGSEARSLRSSCWQVWSLLGPPSSVCRG